MRLRYATLPTAILCMLMLAGPAAAAFRTYFSPQQGGYILNACLADRQTCGKPIADAWCEAMGYTQALTFQRMAADHSKVSRILDSGEFCEGDACQVFRQIKCFAPSGEVATALD